MPTCRPLRANIDAGVRQGFTVLPEMLSGGSGGLAEPWGMLLHRLPSWALPMDCLPW